MEYFLPINYNDIFISNVPNINDASYNINFTADLNYLNQIFLFYVDPSNDYADISDFRFSLHTNQWNPSYETTKYVRKYIIYNLLSDIFGPNQANVLKNIDVFSNEELLDNDINNIFTNVLKNKQKLNLNLGTNGSFDSSYSLLLTNNNIINDNSTNNQNALTKILLEQAKNYEVTYPNSGCLSRQFSDISNTSNTTYSLPNGWRTFQFVENDILSFNVTIKQSPSFFPQWSYNSQALIDGGTSTKYKFFITCKDISNLTFPKAIFYSL